MKLLSTILAATLFSSITPGGSANVHRNLTASESINYNASPRYLKGKRKEKKHNKHTLKDSGNNQVWEDQSSAFEISSLAEQYRAADGCLLNNEKQVDICLANEHSSNIAVHCCRGSIESNNLRCSRDGCPKKKTFAAAKRHCENKGMRLCSVEELESGACCHRGCGWNKQISWTSDSCIVADAPTKSPSTAPTSKPTTSTGKLISISGDRSATYQNTVGFMFEVEAQEDLGITSISMFTGSTAKIWTEIWYRNGSYKGKTGGKEGWEFIYFRKSKQHGIAAPTEITLKEPVYIRKGDTASFYLVSPGRIKSIESDVKEGKVVAENDSIKLFTGTALEYDRWENGCTEDRQCIFSARSFEGAISYIADLTITNEPTGSPTPDPFKKQSSGLTLREEQWLDGHNIRRKKWHEMYGKKYKPLKWSEGLKDMAQEYADKLASVCGETVHDENRGGYGENLASNTGFDNGYGSWGELKSVESVMRRYVERESTWAPPDNWHFMQVLWYTSTHVGCADSKGVKPSGAVCRYQVCRYARTGNCNVKGFDDGSNEWWMKAVMHDSSNCQPFCPPEGCD